MSNNILKFIIDANNIGLTVALISIFEACGSSPGKAGAKMAVLPDGTTKGTVGGGKIEYVLKQDALKAISMNTSINFSYDLDDPIVGMSCGGKVIGGIVVFPPKENLVIAGGGHVSQALAKIASVLNFDVYVIDDRPDMGVYFDNIKAYYTTSYNETDLALSDRSYVVIVTRGHSTDFEAAKFFLEKSSAYVGMIGSKNKVKKIISMLKNSSISTDNIKKLYAPIGLDISDGSPAEVAISIMAEILAVKNKKQPIHLREGIEI